MFSPYRLLNWIAYRLSHNSETVSKQGQKQGQACVVALKQGQACVVALLRPKRHPLRAPPRPSASSAVSPVPTGLRRFRRAANCLQSPVRRAARSVGMVILLFPQSPGPSAPGDRSREVRTSSVFVCALRRRARTSVRLARRTTGGPAVAGLVAGEAGRSVFVAPSGAGRGHPSAWLAGRPAGPRSRGLSRPRPAAPGDRSRGCSLFYFICALRRGARAFRF